MFSTEVSAQNCTLSIVSINFGSYESLTSSPNVATGEITVNCDPDLPFVIKLGPGQNSGSGFHPRKMISSRGNSLTYNLYRDSTRDEVFGDGTGSLSVEGEDLGKVTLIEYDTNGDLIKNEDTEKWDNTLLMPIEPEGTNKLFLFNTFYQAAQDTFPDFAEHLAFKGVIHYDTLKRLLTSNSASAEMQEIWEMVLDGRELTKYALKKEKGEAEERNEYYDNYLAKFTEKTFEDKVEELIETVESNEIRNIGSNVNSPTKRIKQNQLQQKILQEMHEKAVVFFAGTGLFLIGLLFYIIRRKK